MDKENASNIFPWTAPDPEPNQTVRTATCALAGFHAIAQTLSKLNFTTEFRIFFRNFANLFPTKIKQHAQNGTTHTQ